MSEKQKKAKPTYSAYSEVPVTDGVLQWTESRVDNTKPMTRDDREAISKMFRRIKSPLQQIKEMKERIADLHEVTPIMQMYIDAIRAIHEEVLAPPHGFTWERLEKLKEARNHWREIMIQRDLIPVARTGKKIKDSARLGHEAVHGSPAEKEARRKKYVEECLRTAKEHPRWKLTAIREHVAENNGVALKTIERATRNLKTLLETPAD